MKKLILSLFVLLALNSQAQVKEGQTVPSFQFTTVLNAPVQSAYLSRFKGKVVVIDFWATWCGSCLAAMPHLSELQQKHTGKLQVVAVTDETVKRTRQFLAARPSKLWFAVDTSRMLNTYFPHRLIPHTVVISPDGRLIANTSPESITDAVIDSVFRGLAVHLSVKRDLQYNSVEDLVKTTFPAADTVKQKFVMDGEIPGAPGLSTTYRTDSIWNGRRLSALNCNLSTLYRIAYGNMPYERIIDQIGTNDKSPKYRLDIIVENPADLLPTLQKELGKRFDIQAKVTLQERNVYVLRIADTSKFNKIPVNTSGKRSYYANHGAIDQQAITMKDFAYFLESYGTGKLVVDETGNQGRFNIKFTFQPENPQNLLDILADMGLKLDKEQRNINMIVLYKM